MSPVLGSGGLVIPVADVETGGCYNDFEVLTMMLPELIFMYFCFGWWQWRLVTCVFVVHVFGSAWLQLVDVCGVETMACGSLLLGH